MGLAYLFCRAADTIADTDLLPPSERLKYLELFREQFRGDSVAWPAISEIHKQLLDYQKDSSEKLLLSRLQDCFKLLLSFSPADRERIENLVSTLTQGMEMDLSFFPPPPVDTPVPLDSADDLDRYCYYVAGVVGAFWTSVMMGHFTSLKGWEANRMQALSIHFGKGLQMTNILKDLAEDLSQGRCYIPQTVLKEHHLLPEDLLRTPSTERFKPLLASQIKLALIHLENGWQYIMAIPRHQFRLRLACLWPHLFAIKTLQLIYNDDSLLDPEAKVKISRQAVYATMVKSTLLAFSNAGLTHYYQGLTSRLMVSLEDRQA